MSTSAGVNTTVLTSNEKPVQLHIMHSWGGGVELWLMDYIHADAVWNNMVLKSLGIPGLTGQRLALYSGLNADEPLRTWDLMPPIHATSITHEGYRSVLDEIIGNYKVSSMLISSFIGHSLDILNTGLRTAIACHDYYPFCPAIDIYFDRICSECGIGDLERCFSGNKQNRSFPLASVHEWVVLRRSFLDLIRHYNITLTAPSDSVRRNLIRLEGVFRDFDFRIIPHETEWPDKRLRDMVNEYHDIVKPAIASEDSGPSRDRMLLMMNQSESERLRYHPYKIDLEFAKVNAMLHEARVELHETHAELQHSKVALVAAKDSKLSTDLPERDIITDSPASLSSSACTEAPLRREKAVIFDRVSKSYPLYHHITGGFKKFLFDLPHAVDEMKNSRYEALRGITFEIFRGETFGLIGRNGAGKSTLLGLMAGVLRPSGGRVTVNGRVSPLLELGAGFHPELTGKENIMMNGVLLGLTRREVADKLEEIIDFSELGEFIRQPIRMYSSGMLARLGFSIVASLDPEILLIDEILAVGDIRFQKKCHERMAYFKRQGVTIVFVTHSMEEVKRICDRAALIEDHVLKKIGAPDSIVAEYVGSL